MIILRQFRINDRLSIMTKLGDFNQCGIDLSKKSSQGIKIFYGVPLQQQSSQP